MVDAGGNIRVTSRSTDTLSLELAAGGGVVEKTTTPGVAVLDSPTIRALDRATAMTEKLFPAEDALDIEWVVSGGRVLLVQVRPYVEAAGPKKPRNGASPGTMLSQDERHNR